MRRWTLRTKRRLLWIVGYACVAAAVALAAWAILSPPVAMESPVDPTRPAIATGSNLPGAGAGARDSSADVGLTLESFRPLWALDLRRPLYDPPPVHKVEPTFVPPPFPARLMGTVVEPGQVEGTGLAMFATNQNTLELKRVGETLADATVLAIREGEVTLRYYDQEITLMMEGQATP